MMRDEERPSITRAILAIRFGETAKPLLRALDDINTQDEYGRTVLMEAAAKGRKGIVGLALDRGADPNLREVQGLTALWLAANRGHTDVALDLLAHGADPNGATGQGNSILAASACNSSLLQALIARGADLHSQGSYGYTALRYAVLGKCSECAWLLLASDEGVPSLHRAALLDRLPQVRALLSNAADLDAYDPHGMTVLGWAALAGHADVVAALLDAGAESNLADSIAAETPLMSAVRNGSEAAIRCLLDAGAEVDRPDRSGWTALLQAARSGHVVSLQLLLDAVADIDHKGRFGVSALSLASYFGHTEAVRLLLDRGAEVDIRTDDGETPLMEATKEAHHEVMRLLIERGADLNAVADDDNTPLGYVGYWRKRRGTKKLLKAAGARRKPPKVRADGETDMEGVLSEAEACIRQPVPDLPGWPDDDAPEAL
jgi:ankyrin repeat protein